MRLQHLHNVLDQRDLDAVLVTHPVNRKYLSGFTGSAGLLLIQRDRSVLATDSRYFEQVEREAPSFELAKIEGDLAAPLAGLLADAGVRRLGFESQHVTVEQLHAWSQASEGVEWLPLKQTVERIRAVKDKAEIKALRSSVALTDAAFAHLLERIGPGMTEREAAWEIESYMRTNGATRVAFDLIVAAGPNGALPHARAGNRTIQAGDPIVIDIGCVLDGYCSDMTRTICLGKADARYLEVWEIVRQGQKAALEGIHAGMSGVDADALARDAIAEAGFGKYFGHGLGHGVGLDVHEDPVASRHSDSMLAANMSRIRLLLGIPTACWRRICHLRSSPASTCLASLVSGSKTWSSSVPREWKF